MRKTGTKVWARTFLPAVRKLIAGYKRLDRNTVGDRNSVIAYCPLCDSALTFNLNFQGGACNVCPWVVYGNEQGCDKYEKDITQDRLNRLRCWERKLLKIIEG